MYLKLIQDAFARAYRDEADKWMTTDFEETEKALKCRRLHVLYLWNADPKFKQCFHELWPFMSKHKLWNSPTPSQYKKIKNGVGQYMVCMPLQTTFSPKTAAAGAERAAVKKLRPRAWQRRRDGDRNVWRQEFRVSSDDDV